MQRRLLTVGTPRLVHGVSRPGVVSAARVPGRQADDDGNDDPESVAKPIVSFRPESYMLTFELTTWSPLLT